MNISLLLYSILIFSQNTTSFFTPSDTLNIKRRNTIYLVEAAAATSALVGLNQLWYANYDRSSFHTINDNNEWLQMDKFGHVMSSYYIGKTGMNLLNWAGESKKNQLIYGASLGLAFLTTVEVLDGFSEEWGFSVGDMAANATGTGLLIAQELLWDEQRIVLKYSFHTTKYADIRPEILGKNFIQQSLKDYNGQTYWLSANVWSFNKKSNLPKWLNIAFGYGAEGMVTATSDVNFINNSNYTTFERYRQYYLSFDIDLTKIKTQSKLLNMVLSTINFIKIPFPTFEINTAGKTKFHLLYF